MFDLISTLIRGDTYERFWTLQDALGNPVDLTGCAASFGISSPGGGVLFKTSTADATPYIAIPTGTDGTITLAVPGSITAGLTATPPGPPQLICGVRVTFADRSAETYDIRPLTIMRSPLNG